MITIWPDFYESFACKAEDCRHSCCKGWEIDIDYASVALYQGLEGKLGNEIRNSISTESGVYSFRLTEDERCPLLRQDGLCRIILEYGDDYICDICAMHPRFFSVIGDFELAGFGLSCEKSCELLLESGEELSFELEETGKRISFGELIDELGLGDSMLSDTFEAELEPDYLKRIINSLADTEPIDDAWTNHIEFLKVNIDKLYKKTADFYCRCDKHQLNRLYQYILYRHMQRIEEYGIDSLLSFARGAVTFIIIEAAVSGNMEESIRRWSEQIEYSVENTEKLLTAE